MRIQIEQVPITDSHWLWGSPGWLPCRWRSWGARLAPRLLVQAFQKPVQVQLRMITRPPGSEI